MKDTTLITFGCSWTFGEGSGYEEGMTKEQYEKIQHDPEICWQNGWRKPVVEHFGFDHINFGEGGSSNERQFRIAKKFFVSNKFKELYESKKRIIVLWGTTSISRYDVWLKKTNKYEKLFLQDIERDLLKYGDDLEKIGFAIDRFCHWEPTRVMELELEILFWNQYFKLLGIKNFWYDTLSSYRYKIKPSNFFDIDKNDRDMVNIVCEEYKSRNKKAVRIPFEDSFTYAIKNKAVNDWSYHPKKEGYKGIANHLIKKLEENI